MIDDIVTERLFTMSVTTVQMRTIRRGLECWRRELELLRLGSNTPKVTAETVAENLIEAIDDYLGDVERW